MPRSLILTGLVLAATARLALAQDASPNANPLPGGVPAEKEIQDPAAPTVPTTPEVKPKEAMSDQEAVQAVAKDEKVKVLRPEEVPGEVAEIARLRSKADIKAEVTLRTTGGRPVTFKGVIRNGKLIERIIDKQFLPENGLDKTQCGVRLWWSGDSDGFIFFRYSMIQTLTLTGKLTDEERQEIMRRLEAKRAGKEGEKAAAPAEQPVAETELEKLTPEELKQYLVSHFPYDMGWNHDKKRELSRKQVMENQALSREETIFLKYFNVLMQYHFEDLKREKDRLKLEPGSAQPPAQPGTQPPQAQPQPVPGDQRGEGDAGVPPEEEQPVEPPLPSEENPEPPQPSGGGEDG